MLPAPMPLMEREAELAKLATMVGRAARGEGGFVVAAGTAGVGKTRLLAEAARLAGELGGQVLTARGTELERYFSLSAPRQLFEPTVAVAPEDQRRLWLGGAAAPAATVLGLAGGGDRPAGDFAVLHGLFWLTANLCQDALLMLVVDDLHWLDAGSLRFLAYLQPRLEGMRLAVVTATRTHEPSSEQHMLDLLLSDPSSMVLRPPPLSQAGSVRVMQEALGGRGDGAFLSACHLATGGNPLLLRELAIAVTDAGLPATADNAGQVETLGGRALSTRVSLRLAGLPAECTAVARAVAILGDDVGSPLVAALAELDAQATLDAAGQLERLEILCANQTEPAAPLLAFVHPLVRAAVYDQLDPGARLDGHVAAARLLQQSGADPDRIASHLLRVPPREDPQVVDTLLRAAKNGLRRGSPDTAVIYLQRCLQEPPSEHELLDVLEELGMTARAVDHGVAARYLEQALALVTEPMRAARIAHVLGDLYLTLLDADRARTVWVQALDRLPAGEEDLRRRILAGIMYITRATPGAPRSWAMVEEARRLEFHDSIGGRALESMIGMYLAYAANPDAVEHARRALSGGRLLEHSSASVSLARAWAVLLYADDPAVADSIDAALALAHRQGRINDLANGLLNKTLWQLRQGELAQAEATGRECQRMTDMSRIAFTRPMLGAYLSETLLELGRPREAEAALDWVGLPEPARRHAPMHVYLHARARQLRMAGQLDRALRMAREAGERFTANGGDNPAFAAWRSEAAQCLAALDRTPEAAALADEQVVLARRWNAPWALGHALRVAGLIHRGDGLPLLREAAAVLEKSSARLEYAKSLVDLGAALRRMGQRAGAKDHLVAGLDIAYQRGATLLIRGAVGELRAIGARVPRMAHTGPDALTNSERRVVELAVQGLTNRDIAQQLFITIKTVEVHLGSAYRKLDIQRRSQLEKAIRPSA